MSKTIHYWCDSGANVHSTYRGKIALEELGMTEDEWLELTNDERDNVMREIALERLDWGYRLEE